MPAMRPSTLETLGLGTPLEMFQRGALPISVEQAVDEVFGTGEDRGCLVV